MSVVDLNKIDGVGKDKKENALRLIISDHLDWQEEDIHIEVLQDKINAYLQYIDGRQYVKSYGEGISKFYIDIHFMETITEKCTQFLNVASRQLNPHNIYINTYSN